MCPIHTYIHTQITTNTKQYCRGRMGKIKITSIMIKIMHINDCIISMDNTLYRFCSWITAHVWPAPSYILHSCSLNFDCWFYFIRTHFYFVVAKQLDELIWNVWQCERDVCIGRKYFHISLAKPISSASHLNSGRERLCIRENNKYIIKWCYDDYY